MKKILAGLGLIVALAGCQHVPVQPPPPTPCEKAAAIIKADEAKFQKDDPPYTQSLGYCRQVDADEDTLVGMIITHFVADGETYEAGIFVGFQKPNGEWSIVHTNVVYTFKLVQHDAAQTTTGSKTP